MPKPVLKLIDFGEANTFEEAVGDVAGTPGFMAPEMEEHGAASSASDMFVCYSDAAITPYIYVP